MKKIILALLISSSFAHKTIEDLSEVEVSVDSSTVIIDQEEGVKEDQFKLEMPTEEIKKQTWKERVVAFFSHEPEWYWTHFKEEFGYMSVIVLIAINYYIGKSKTTEVLGAWRKNNLPVLVQQYPHMGCNSETRNMAVVQISYSEYEYFASGRKNCWYTMFKLNMKRRHCLLTNYVLDKYLGTLDTMTIEIPMNLDSKEYPIEFFICRRKDLKAKMAAMEYLSDMVKNSNAKNYRLGDKEAQDKNALMIMSEHDEVANHLVDEVVGKVLLSLGSHGLLHEMHVTD